MRGYPKYINTVKDYENLLSLPEYAEQAMTDLKTIQAAEDDQATKVVLNEATGEETVETIANPMPLWKRKGFASRTAFDSFVSAKETETGISGGTEAVADGK